MADEREAVRREADEREAVRREGEEIEGHMPARRANEPGPDAENDDPQTREGIRRANEEPDAEDGEVEGHEKR